MTFHKAENPGPRQKKKRTLRSVPPNPPAPPVRPSMATASSSTARWDREQIQCARKTPLAPLLRRRGYPLRARPGENFQVEDHQDLVVKDCYWVWPSHQMKGNAIDFFMLVECRSFNEAMEILATENAKDDD
jgi:hypothetical protein